MQSIPFRRSYSKNPSKKQTYFGYKVHAITTSSGAIKAFEITAANIDERKGLEKLSLELKADSIILGDKGYVSEPLARKLKEQGQTLLALKRSNSREKYPPLLQEAIFRTRRRIETTFSQLAEQLNVERVLSKTFDGLSLRLLTKILAFNLCLLLAQSTQIKSLIF